MAPIDVGWMTPADVAGCAVIVALYAGLIYKNNRDIFFKFLVFVLGLQGVSVLLFPSAVLSFWGWDKMNDNHFVLARLLAIWQIAQAFLMFLSLKSRDKTVPGSLLTAFVIFILGCGVTLVNISGKDARDQPFSKRQWFLGIFHMMVFSTTVLFYLSRGSTITTFSQRSNVSCMILRAQFYFNVFSAILHLATPIYTWQMFYNMAGVSVPVPDSMALMMILQIGVTCLTSSVQDLQATGYMYPEDKQHHFIAMSVKVCLHVLSLFIFGILPEFKVLLLVLVTDAAYLASNAFGYLAVEEESGGVIPSQPVAFVRRKIRSMDKSE